MNGCVGGCTLMGCWHKESGGMKKKENEICSLSRDICGDGLKCVEQDDGCDNGAGRCEKSGIDNKTVILHLEI